MNHRGTILLSAAVLLLSACGTPAEFAATFQGDGIYGNFVPQTYQPKSREDFERMAADNLQNRQRDTLVVLVDESPSWRFGLSFGFGPWGWNFGPSWSFGWHSRWYDPWYCGGWYDPWYYGGWYDPWYRSSWYYGGWYDPWYYPYGYYGGWYDPWYHHHHNHGIWHNQGTYTPRASTRPGTAGYGPAPRSAAGVMNRPGASTSSSPRGAGSRSGAYIGGGVPRASYSPTPVSTSRSGGAIGRSGASSTVRTSTGASTRTSTQSTRSSGTSTRSSASPTRSSSSSSYSGSSSRSSYGGGSSYSGGSHSSGSSYSGGSHSGGGNRR